MAKHRPMSNKRKFLDLIFWNFFACLNTSSSGFLKSDIDEDSVTAVTTSGTCVTMYMCVKACQDEIYTC